MGTKCPPVLPKMPWKGKTQGEPTFLQKNLPSALAMKSSSSLGSPVQGKAQGRMVEHTVGKERMRMDVSLEKRRQRRDLAAACRV